MNIIRKVTVIVCLCIFTVLWFIPNFVYKEFGEMNLDQILFVILGNNTGANNDILYNFTKIIIPKLIISLAILVMILSLLKFMKKFTFMIKLEFFNKNIVMSFNLKVGKLVKFSIVLLVIVLTGIKYNNLYGISTFIRAYNNAGTLYEEHYIDPNSVSITFPEQKRNLIYIILESMNTNFSTMTIDNHENVNLIPKIEELANNNISFSNNELFGGHTPIRGATWTMGSLVSQSAGVPLSGPLNGNSYGEQGFFLPGITAIGDILQDNGYSNYFAIGSDSAFAGRDVYFDDHGQYEIFDLDYWRNEGKINKDYHVFWGMEDRKLFEYSKTKLLEISNKKEPFNYTMLTVDTHFGEGYTDVWCELPYESNYANAISCSDTNILEFVNWIKNQDFYENTTVILVGDHSTMNSEFLSLTTSNDYALYNTFLNIDNSINLKETRFKNRLFTAFDMFPTTLSSLGVEIEGSKLGLGVDIFSTESTLLEKWGIEVFNDQIAARSNYYNENFHKYRNGVEDEK